MKSLLLLEEDAEARESLAKVLRKVGFSVVQARDEQSALDALGSTRPVDVVLAGATEQDRLEFLADLRARRPQVPVIFLTDYCSPEAKLRGLLFGAFSLSRRLNFYMNMRPIRLNELIRLLHIIPSRRCAGAGMEMAA